jgi:hypothetical protein
MRLGDDIDDYCSRCKLSTTHAVVSTAGEEAQKVRCRTCNHEHNYRKNKGGRGPMSKKEAFDKVMASFTGAMPETKSSGKK